MEDLRAAQLDWRDQPATDADIEVVAAETLEEATQRRATMLGPIAPAFMPEKWFQGSREGKVFKNGSLGQGYYTTKH